MTVPLARCSSGRMDSSHDSPGRCPLHLPPRRLVSGGEGKLVRSGEAIWSEQSAAPPRVAKFPQPRYSFHKGGESRLRKAAQHFERILEGPCLAARGRPPVEATRYLRSTGGARGRRPFDANADRGRAQGAGRDVRQPLAAAKVSVVQMRNPVERVFLFFVEAMEWEVAWLSIQWPHLGTIPA